MVFDVQSMGLTFGQIHFDGGKLRDVMERDLATVREQLRIQEMRSAEQAAQFERAQHRIQELMLQLARTTQERDHARQQANELLADMQRQQGLMPDGR